MKQRIIGIDVIKVVAVFFVISVHFFLRTNFYDQDLTSGENLFIQSFLRWIFYICVPLFVVATGYLQSKKEISSKHYKGLLPVLGVYIFYSVATIFVRIHFFDEKASFINWVYKILRFEADGYSWYVNMYIGLFLLIPFLNLIHNNLKSKKEHIILIGTLIFLCGLPSFFNNMPISIHGSKFIFFFLIGGMACGL